MIPSPLKAQVLERPLSAAKIISQRIKYMKKGKPFSRAIFVKIGSRSAVNKALSTMVRKGFLERIIRGIYMRPKHSTYIGRVRPSPLKIVGIISKVNGEIIQVHGAEAARRLGLSTQMQLLPTYYTSGYTRSIKAGNAVVRLQHVCKQRLQHAGTKVGLALTVLYYIGKEGVSTEVLRKISEALNGEEFTKLRASNMPKWMSLAFESFDDHSKLDNG